ncbi:MAG TPA: NAD(P)H-dependent oxidoreductase subunit E [Phycisphaerae bacterium]|nr:NAD(P)H-dependent oxidoreductase subunit E [Phycisphaerae bacterium]
MVEQAVKVKHAGTPGRRAVDRQDILHILDAHVGDRGGLIAILEEIQSRYGYLPEPALRIVSEETGRSLVDIYGIATFYRAFSLVPRGVHLVCACLGTACHVRGAPRVVDELESQLGIHAGETTPDGKFTLETVNCLGACALGPVVVIDGRYFSKVSRSDIRQLLEDAAAGLDPAASRNVESTFPIETACPRCNHSLTDARTLVDGLPAARMILAVNGAVGPCHLSSLYGGTGLVCALEAPEGTVGRFYCPRCQSELESNEACDDCGAPMARLNVRGGGMVHVCRRRGCHAQRLDLDV